MAAAKGHRPRPPVRVGPDVIDPGYRARAAAGVMALRRGLVAG
jgi:hypothetical protein